MRETVVKAMIAEQGHVLVDDMQEGWTRCSRCAVSWFVRRRALLAAGERDAGTPGVTYDNPLSFGQCWPP